jgi:RHS repeat-associated protein
MAWGQQASMIPDEGNARALASTPNQVLYFWLTNGSSSDQWFVLGCEHSGSVTSCTPPPNTTVPANATVALEVTYSTGPAGGGWISLWAVSPGDGDDGSYNVSVLLPYSVAVTPDGATVPTRLANTGGFSETFTITNTGYHGDTFTIGCIGSSNITCTGTSVSSVNLASGTSTLVTASYSASDPGTGTLTLTASAAGHSSDAGSYSVPVSVIVIDATPHNGDYRDATKCVADCFDATVTYTTPAYISMDTPRSVTLIYRSSQAQPMGFVQVDATDITSPAPDRMSIRLQRPDQTWVTFTNGSQEIFHAAGAGTSRLAVQFDASGLGTGAYSYTVVAGSWRNGSFQEITHPVRVLVLNEQGSPFGAGWSIPGFQRLLVQSGGSVVITEGDGSIAFFQIGTCGSSCSFASPPGDFTTVTSIGAPPTITGYQRKYPDGTLLTFNASGRLTSIKDRFNNQTSYAYDGSNRLSTITDPASKVITFGYGADGRLDWIRDPGNRSTLVTINGAGDVTEIVDPANVSALRPSNGVEHRMKQRLDRRGSPWGFAYDFAGKLTADTMPTITADGQVVRPVLQFSSIERAVLVDPASGLGTSTNPAPRVLPANVRASITNPRGFTTQYTLDRFGAETRVEKPLGRTTKLARNTHSQVTADTTPSGHVTEYTWSGPRLTKVVDRTTLRTVNIDYELTYNEVLKVYGDIDTVVNVWTGGKLTSTRRANRAATMFLHDTRGRVTQQTDPAGHITTFHYAATGWQNTDSVKASGRRTAFTYDVYGRRISVKNPLNYVTTFAYDSINRNTRTVGPIADTTRFDFDSLYLRAVTDPRGQRYVYARNALGWVEVRTDPGLRQDSASYDRNGNLTRSVNRRHQSVGYTYDSLDQLATRTADGATTTYAVDPAQRFRAAANGESTDTLKFDVAGRREFEITLVGGTRYERRASYNIRDLRTALEVVAPWRDTISYRYNANMLLDTLIDLKGDRTRHIYDGDLLLASIELPPPGLDVSRVSHSTHLPSHVTYPNHPTVNGLIGLTFDIDNRGLIWKRRNTKPVGQGDTTWTFVPDTLGRIRRYTTLGVDSIFTYDKVGNRTDLGGQVIAGNRLVKFNADSLFYDADGNLVKRRRAGADVQRLYWNSVGQLVAVWMSGGDSVSFAYDGFGRRARKWTATRTTRFIWDGEDLLAELDGSGNRVAEYVYYLGTDRPHSVRRSGSNNEVYYFAQDFPGHVLGLFNTSGVLVWQNRYSTFGSELSGFPRGAVPSENFLRFAGRELDVETGLYYVRSRYYDPRVGRFISEDPIGLAGGINPYVYAGNNPINFRDPYGLDHDCGYGNRTQSQPGAGAVCMESVGVDAEAEGYALSYEEIVRMNTMGRGPNSPGQGGVWGRGEGAWGWEPRGNVTAEVVRYITSEIWGDIFPDARYCTLLDCGFSLPFGDVSEFLGDADLLSGACNPLGIAAQGAATGLVSKGIVRALAALGVGIRGGSVGGPAGFAVGVAAGLIVCGGEQLVR